MAFSILERIREADDIDGMLAICEADYDRTDCIEPMQWVRDRCRDKGLPIDVYWKTHLLMARKGDFDSYLLYLEKDRPAEERFYLPRRKVLKPLVDDLQKLFDGEYRFLGISLPPRVGKSTLCIMYMTFVMGHRPKVASVMSGFSDKLTDGFYNEILSIIEDREKYNWHEIFAGVEMVNKSAKNESIDLVDRKRFPTITCRSVSGTLTGAVEIGNGGILYCDDLVEDLEESLNPVRLEAKYNAYLNQLKDRKKNNAYELMVGTRWNVFDPLGRIAEQYEDDPSYHFTVIPALNENDESNFVYDYGVGFSTEYYHDMRKSIDDATWWAKYMGQPYIREGLLFPANELNYYNGVLPAEEPDRIVAVCDTAWGGGDSTACPIAYVYGEGENRLVYVADVVFNNGDKTVTIPAVTGKFKEHRPHMARFESNNGGHMFADEVDRMLRDEGVRVNISTKPAPTRNSKLSRIIQYSPDIRNMYFVDKEHQSPEYRKFMNEVTMFTVSGKNPHDDAPDSLAMLSDFVMSGTRMVSAFRRPF